MFSNKMHIYIVILLTLMILTSCQSSELYYYNDTEKVIDVNNDTKSILNECIYLYEGQSLISSDYDFIRFTPRGAVYINNTSGIVYVYNPETGTKNTLCSDVLCQHTLNSGCPFGYLILNSPVPIYYDESLYCFYRNFPFPDSEGNITESSHFYIQSSDMFGNDIKQIYKNDGNLITGFIVSGEYIFFIQTDSDKHTVLYRINTNGKNIISMVPDDEEELIIDYFTVCGEKVYYMTDDGNLYCCDLNFSNTALITDFKRISIVVADIDNNLLLLINGQKISKYDIKTGDFTDMVIAPEGKNISKHCIDDNIIMYQLQDDEVIVNYRIYKSKISGSNILYSYNYITENSTEYMLPDDVLISPYVYLHDDYIYFLMMEESQNISDYEKNDPETNTIVLMDYYILSLKTMLYIKIN